MASKEQQHLQWIYDRLLNHYKENPNVDYMVKFAEIIHNMEEKKTSQEWEKEYPDIKILDPDGWDRTNYQYSFFEELITKKQFEERMFMSTCMVKNPKKYFNGKE